MIRDIDARKVSQVMWINEISHHVTAKVHVLRLRIHEWTEADSFEDIRACVGREPSIAPRIESALSVAYECATGRLLNGGE